MKHAHPELGPPEQLAHGDFEIVVQRLAEDLAFGTDASLFTGSGLEYAQSRIYEPGDPIKQIDWKLSARTQRIHVKEYEALKRTAVYLLLDTSASMSVSSGGISKHDLGVWSAAAIGLVAQKRLSPCAIVGAGERRTRHEPSLLRSDLWQALEPLRMMDHSEGTNLASRMQDLVIRAPRSSMIVVLSDLHDPEALVSIRRGIQKHDVVVLQLRDPAEREPLRAGFFRGREAETGREFIGHGRQHWRSSIDDHAGEDLGRAIMRSGGSWLLLDTDKPFVPLLRHFLSSRALAGGGRA